MSESTLLKGDGGTTKKLLYLGDMRTFLFPTYTGVLSFINVPGPIIVAYKKGVEMNDRKVDAYMSFVSGLQTLNIRFSLHLLDIVCILKVESFIKNFIYFN